MQSPLSRLILIDGFPGSGKSMAGALVSSALAEQGRTVRFIHETDGDTPLHPFPPDEMGTAWGDIHLHMSHQEFAEQSLGCWRTFVGPLGGDEVAVVESFPFQCAVRVLLQMVTPPPAIEAYWNAWQEIVLPLNPVLVYLHEPDPMGLIDEICRKRGKKWTAYAERSVERTLRVERRGFKGRKAIEDLFDGYGRIIAFLLPSAKFPVHTFEARPKDYDARQSAIESALFVPK